MKRSIYRLAGLELAMAIFMTYSVGIRAEESSTSWTKEQVEWLNAHSKLNCRKYGRKG